MKQHVIPASSNSKSLTAMVETFKATADPTSAQIMLIFTQSERGVGDLAHQAFSHGAHERLGLTDHDKPDSISRFCVKARLGVKS
jgi:hypothetical protein